MTKSRKKSYMDTRLSTLIDDYLKAVRTALTLMQQSGITLPQTSGEWLEADLSQIPTLLNGIHYFTHGVGCEVELPEGSVDFDFGPFGEISGLDAWRLDKFATARHEDYGFASSEEFHQCFEYAVKAKHLTPMSSDLSYRSDAPLQFVSSIDSRHQGDSLPHKDLDDVLTLQIHYFYSADLMRENYETLLSKSQNEGELSQNEKIYLRIYLSSWLGFLAVTCEGYRNLNMYLLLNNDRPREFQELIPRCNMLNSAISEHYDDLRKYRNNVFHLRTDLNDTLGFLSPGKNRLAWARSIHQDLDEFFRDYRIFCQCHYIVNGRQREIDPNLKEL